ncbi:DNA cytosine methyltransferase [Nocardia tengchongensis]|uniref:DNA cytosine methyltransferase n=1 Tax=Nocardia tengchongensis TaxID=2055889 RepID=UPI00367F3D57
MPSDTAAAELSLDAVDPSEVEMIDLFAGPGGLDVAARWLGIPAVGIEVNEDACRTRLRAGLGTRHADVRNHDLLDDFPNAKILTGGPPCQTYSVAGSGAGRRALTQVLGFVSRIAGGARAEVEEELGKLDDERTGLVLQPLLWALEAFDKGRPFETIVLEQVPTVKPVWDAYAPVLKDLGYEVEVDLVHTEQFGVPQTRRRAILIACRNRGAVFPRATHRAYNKRLKRTEGVPGLREWATLGEALKPPKAEWVKDLDLPERPSSFEVVSNYGTGGNPKLRGKRTSNEPSATVTGKVRRNRIVADGEDFERLLPEEAGRLQTFPLDYPWSGNDQYQQVGNAIPPRVGVHILAAALFGKKPNENALDRAVGGSWLEALADLHQLRLSLEFFPDEEEPAGSGRQAELFPIDLDSLPV